MKALIAEKDYLSAAEIADSINWRKVRNVNLLMKAGEPSSKKNIFGMISYSLFT